jgi:hypothetical protein
LVTVAGFEGGTATIKRRSITIVGSGGGATIANTSSWTSNCGAFFQGETAVVNALKQPSDTRISQSQRERAELRSLEPGPGQCDRWSYANARAAYLSAVQLTIEHGREYGIDVGAVGAPFDLLHISSDGKVVPERLEQVP